MRGEGARGEGTRGFDYAEVEFSCALEGPREPSLAPWFRTCTLPGEDLDEGLSDLAGVADERACAAPCGQGMKEGERGVSPHGRLVLLDTETTGLHGAGVLAWVIALSWYEPSPAPRWIVAQWTLRDPAAEPAMLREVFAGLGARSRAHLGTYNGRTFDLPLLRARARAHAIDASVLDAPHLDLLPVARRLFRGVADNCRLVTLERTLLGIDRQEDVDGYAIAGAFERLCLADPSAESLVTAVQRPNRADVLGLSALIWGALAALRAPIGARQALGAARHFHGIGAQARAMLILEPWLDDPLLDESAPLDSALAIARAVGHTEALALLRARRRRLRKATAAACAPAPSQASAPPSVHWDRGHRQASDPREDAFLARWMRAAARVGPRGTSMR